MAAIAVFFSFLATFKTRRGWLGPAPFLFGLLLVVSCKDAPPGPRAATPQDPIQWEHIETWSGRGTQYLDSFPAEGALRIEWEAKRSPNATTPGTLRIVMHSAISGRALAAPVVDHPGEGKGTAYFSEEPRVFFASVISADIE